MCNAADQTGVDRAGACTAQRDVSSVVRPQLRTCARPSPMQYLTDRRLTLAPDYLLAGELTLEQIADRTGTGHPTRSRRHSADTLDWRPSMAPALLVKAATGGAGIASAAALALMGPGGVPTKIDRRRSQMESPIEVVRRFCTAWSDNVRAGELAAFFTDDAVYHNIPLAPGTGREAIAKTISSFIRPGAPGIESIDFRVINIAANGPVVMTERVDVFRLPGKSFY